MPLPALSVRTTVLISCAVLLAYLGALSLEPPEGGTALQRWLSDDSDRGVYFDRAQFYAQGRTPYRDVFSEYPTLATLAFAGPYLLPGASGMTPDRYMFRWSCLMAAVVAVTIAIVATFRRAHGWSAAPALLLLGPSALYFGLNRFDIVCACLVCVSLFAFTRGRALLAYVLLGVATMVKVYPVVVVPVYLAYHLRHDPTRLRMHVLRYAAAYGLTVLTIVGLTIAWVTWDGFLVPYRFQGGRDAQFFNPYWVLERSWHHLALDAAVWHWIGTVFVVLQFSIVPLLWLVRVRSLADVVRFSVLAIYLFVTFARIDSPQWILWYVPAILMIARGTSTLRLVAMLTVCNYIVFPVAFDYAFSVEPTTGQRWFSAVVLVKDLVLLALVVALFRERGVLDEPGGLEIATREAPVRVRG